MLSSGQGLVSLYPSHRPIHWALHGDLSALRCPPPCVHFEVGCPFTAHPWAGDPGRQHGRHLGYKL